jgi:hypothetical protein
MFKKIWLVLGLLVLVVGGCAKPPVDEKAAAVKALNAAMTAGAEQYMTVEMEAAKKMLADAEGAMAGKKYSDAQKGYVESKSAFEKASAGVNAAKQAMTAENKTVIEKVEKQWSTIAVKAKKAAKKMTKGNKAAWKIDEPAAKKAIKAAKDANAKNPIEARNQINNVSALADKWAGILK